MKNSSRRWLAAAIFLTTVGLILFISAMTACGWNFAVLSTAEFETNVYEISESFRSLSIRTDTADVAFALSDDAVCRVECYEETKARHAVFVENDTLTINVSDEKSWFDYIGINFASPKITVYLPGTRYASLLISGSTGDVQLPADFRFESIDISVSTGDISCGASASGSIRIKTGTGDIDLTDISADTLDLSVSTGSIRISGADCTGDAHIRVSTGKTFLTDMQCKNLISTGSTGDISLGNVIAGEKLSIERSTGDVAFDGCDAAEISVKTSTGKVSGTLLSEKTFFAESGTGKIDVPEGLSGGRCEVATGTGDIHLEID